MNLPDRVDMSANSKKSFEFRMSKKVAELTQVVHLLFSRNHEKEVELESIKDAYEFEIELVIKDAKSKILDLDNRIQTIESDNALNEAKIRNQNEADRKALEAEYQKRVAGLEAQLNEEKSENKNLRDLLITARDDLELMKQNGDKDLQNTKGLVTSKDGEIAKLKQHIKDLEKRNRESDKHWDNVTHEIRTGNARLQKELSQTHELFEDVRKTKEVLSAKNKQLETDIKTLKKELSKRISDVVAAQNGRQREPSLVQLQHSHTESCMPPRRGVYGHVMDDKPKLPPISEGDSDELEGNSEIDRLRREIQRYKMELSNRENNFNRVFQGQHPVLVDPRAGKIGQRQQQMLSNGQVDAAISRATSRTGREKTFSYANSQVYEEEPTYHVASRSESARSSYSQNQLPSLGQSAKLIKPKLPKEMLITKS